MTDQEAPLPDEQPRPFEIIGAISTEESAMLSLVGDPETNQDVADMYAQRFIGHSLGEGKAYALVTQEDEQGELKASHYVYLGKDDFGTTIMPKAAERIGLPDPSQSLASMSGNLTLPSKQSKPEAEGLSGAAKVYFDLLTAPRDDEEPVKNGLSFEKEEARNPRLVKILAPRLTREEARDARSDEEKAAESAETVEEYTRLVKGLAPLKQPETPAERSVREMNEPYVTLPTEEQIDDSLTRLQEAESDRTIKAIITKHAGSDVRDAGVINSIRTNADLRYELGSYLLRDKLPQMRITRSDEIPRPVYLGLDKTPNHKGYYHLGKIKGDEYAVVIALSMIDGTFEKPHNTDRIVRNEHGYGNGVHRAGAAVVLSKDNHSARRLEDSLIRDQR